MPPKKADPKAKDVAPVIEEKELSLSLKFVDKTSQTAKQYRARIFCNWLDCCTLTELIIIPNHNNIKFLDIRYFKIYIYIFWTPVCRM